MKVALVHSSSVRWDKTTHDRSKICEALLTHNIQCMGYATTNLDKPFTRWHTYGKSYTTVFPGSIPILSKLARKKGKSLFRKIIIALENLSYALQILRRLPQDKVDVYLILHLWEYEIPFLNLILRIFRPTIILWVGGSLRWYERLGRIYYLFVSAYRMSLRTSLTLVDLDPEQECYLFKVLKLPRNKVTNFKEKRIDHKVFRRLDKNISAKKVGFDRSKTNIVMVSRLEKPEYIELHKDNEKDPFSVLAVFRHLVEKKPKMSLHVIGRGAGMKEFKRRVAQHGLQDKVKIYGWIENERLPEYYSAADLTFYPAPLLVVNDGQANRESYLCGTPVIYFKRYPWAKTETPGGFFVDRDTEAAAQQILSRLNSTYLLKKRKEATSIAQDYTMEAFGNHMTKILKQHKNE